MNPSSRPSAHRALQQNDPTRTRRSQVSHYLFCWLHLYTPAYSDQPMVRLDTRTIVDIATRKIEPNLHFGARIEPQPPPPRSKRSTLARLAGAFRRR
jgi:hypothetical protein